MTRKSWGTRAERKTGMMPFLCSACQLPLLTISIVFLGQLFFENRIRFFEKRNAASNKNWPLLKE